MTLVVACAVIWLLLIGVLIQMRGEQDELHRRLAARPPR